MIPAGQPLPPGYCQHCREECRDTTGAVIYPHLPELADKVIWQCVFCGATVGTHEDGPHKGKALGTAADPELRKARQLVHAKLDPLWQKAFEHPDYASARAERIEAERRKALAIIKRTARKRVYRFLAHALSMSEADCHISMMGIEDCRRVWLALSGISYSGIRDWCRANPVPARMKAEKPKDADEAKP